MFGHYLKSHKWTCVSSKLFLCLIVSILAVQGSPKAQPLAAQSKPESSPRVFLLDAKQLQVVKQRLRDGDKSLAAALAKLESDAQKALTVGAFSVVSKEATPPSGDKHDYMSQAPYFWPNPE